MDENIKTAAEKPVKKAKGKISASEKEKSSVENKKEVISEAKGAEKVTTEKIENARKPAAEKIKKSAGKPSEKRKIQLKTRTEISGQEFKRLLRLRRQAKVRRPRFVRIESWAQPSLKLAWRKPTGRHSKTLAGIWGRPKMPTTGYGSPGLVRGLNPQGFRETRVFNPAGLEKINKDKEIAVIAAAVGRKKRLEILKKADSMGIKVRNR
jgi:large subunit ribosomal protein L32e